jgi:hypothetical protein
VKDTICMIRGVEDEWQYDAANNPYPTPYYIGFCGSMGYTSGDAWDYFKEPMDIEEVTCKECLDAYALYVLSEVP